MSSCEQDLSEDGLGKICLQNDKLRVSILPEAGGKIAQIVDLASGRNWLWNNPDIPFERSRYDVDYGKVLDSGGWDEVLLSISPAQLSVSNNRTCNIPDHGDLVGQVWTVTRTQVEADGDAVCEMTVQGRAANYQISRAIRLKHHRARLELNYSIINRETFAWPWYWCAHALLAAEDDMHIDLPARQTFHIDQLSAKSDCAQSVARNWPMLDLSCGAALDLSRSFASTAEDHRFAGKIFVRSPKTGSVAVAIGDTHEQLCLQYDPAELPWLGLWINNHGWSENGVRPYQNLGLEPATTRYDNVVDAIENDAITWLQPGETRNWSLAVELRS